MYERFRWAEDLFEQGDYLSAGRVLEDLFADVERGHEEVGHGLTDARMLLARAYYHSGQLGRAERTSRRVLDADPTDAYAALLLARTLERGSRREEAQQALRLALALGAPGVVAEPGVVEEPGVDVQEEAA
ncbi:MAG: tetratricopeptide repeat protein [Actinomycetes bacterium]